MGIFDRFRRTPSARSTPAGPAAPADGSPAPGSCRCPEHVDDLLDLALPYTAEMAVELGAPSATVGELIGFQALGVHPVSPENRWLEDWADDERATTPSQRGPFDWELWLGDEGRAHYEDDAAVQIDEALLRQPGVHSVIWEDREVFHVGVDGLCDRGVLAAMARALTEPGVRLG